MSEGALLVTAHLSSPLAGEAPYLESLCEWALSPMQDAGKPGPGFKITRAGPAPAQGEIAIPILRERLGQWSVAHASAPILPECRESVEHIAKRVAVEEAGLLDPDERRVVSTTNSWTKSYRLPLRVRRVERVCWIALGSRRGLLHVLRDVHAIGKKVADGYGRVSKWEVVRHGTDWTWYAQHERGTVLMRSLPVGAWLPKDLLGYRRDFGACVPPLWHPERYTEIVTPC